MYLSLYLSLSHPPSRQHTCKGRATSCFLWLPASNLHGHDAPGSTASLSASIRACLHYEHQSWRSFLSGMLHNLFQTRWSKSMLHDFLRYNFDSSNDTFVEGRNCSLMRTANETCSARLCSTRGSGLSYRPLGTVIRPSSSTASSGRDDSSFASLFHSLRSFFVELRQTNHPHQQ